MLQFTKRGDCSALVLAVNVVVRGPVVVTHPVGVVQVGSVKKKVSWRDPA